MSPAINIAVMQKRMNRENIYTNISKCIYINKRIYIYTYIHIWRYVPTYLYMYVGWCISSSFAPLLHSFNISMKLMQRQLL